ncbi:melanocortin-2 receptor accessory protein isoform X1 [Zonotrichia albicollis]|uniref:melanocortin-2 receptor accessory protein isoform X1 n=1 Tax=Zonotrichia albicollis TaxID=44394 RepID=UPI003D80F05B
MANSTNSSEYFWSYEYYWDYIDPIPVDGSKLKVNKYSIVIAFWVGLAAFVMFLFLVLLCMSCSGSTPANPAVCRHLLLVPSSTATNGSAGSGRSSLGSDCARAN